MRLDIKQNGLLSKNELLQYNWGITKIFVERLFEVTQTYEGQMDYKGFLDFVLAYENKKTPEALQYFWKVLDVYGKGALDTFVINLFFKEVIKKLESQGEMGFKVVDIIDEIFDMVKPATPNVITQAEFLASGQGDIIITMLIDAKGFWDYDQRENSGGSEEEEDPEYNKTSKEY